MTIWHKGARRKQTGSITAIRAHDRTEPGASETVGLDRRSFLARSGAAAAMVGLVASVPGGTTILGAFETDAPALDTDAAPVVEGDAATMSDPVVAHVKDLASGEISIYSGSQEVVLRNPGLAAQLVRASR